MHIRKSNCATDGSGTQPNKSLSTPLKDSLLKELLQLVDTVDLDQMDTQRKLETEVARLQKFSGIILGHMQKITIPTMNTQMYAKYILREGTREEKRELLGCLKSKLFLKDGKLTLHL